jgi:hypothetical protein
MMRDDGLEYLMALDRWLEGKEEGIIPAELLKQRGIDVPPAAELDDASLHERLWTVIRAMAEIGMFLESTDHLSGRELYDHLESVVLREPTFLVPDDLLFGAHCDIIGGCSEEDIRVYLTYYADEEERQSFRDGFEGEFPPALPRPYDRDRFLPTHEERIHGESLPRES